MTDPATELELGNTEELRSTPQQKRSRDRLAQLRQATKKAVRAVGWQRVTTQLIATMAEPPASIGTIYRYYPDVHVALTDAGYHVATHGIEQVMELHHPITLIDGTETEHQICNEDEQQWPCATHRALTEEPA